jgi:hypothetical protein
MIPLYGFLQGDTLGLVILGDEGEPVSALADKLLQAASVRVPRQGAAEVWHNGQCLDPRLTVRAAGLKPLDKFEVIQTNPLSSGQESFFSHGAEGKEAPGVNGRSKGNPASL